MYYTPRYLIAHLLVITFFVTTFLNVINLQRNFRALAFDEQILIALDDFKDEEWTDNNNINTNNAIPLIPTTTTSRLLPSLSSSSKNNKNEKHSLLLTKEGGNIKYITKKSVSHLGVKAFDSLHLWHQIHTLQVYSKGVPRELGSVNYIDEKDGIKTSVAFDGYTYNPPDIRSWEKDKSIWERKGRFPCIQERIEYYMGQWYQTKPQNKNLFKNKNDWDKLPCNFMNETSKLTNHLLCFPNDPSSSSYLFSPKRLFFFSTKKHLKPTSIYIEDLIDLSILHKNSTTPVIVHIGDGASLTYDALDKSYPVFNKVRVMDISSENNKNNNKGTSTTTTMDFKYRSRHMNIIWPLNRKRHLAPASEVPLFDIPWEKKISKLVWRGRVPKNFEKVLYTTSSIEYGSWKQRIALVKKYENSTLINAKFVGVKRMPQKTLYGTKLGMKSMLKYKYQLSIEGNDVASGLKWMLFSNSLVFMPKNPTFSSWAMESLLEPFVHYIPIQADMSNVEDMVQWANDNPMEAEQIAQRGTLFMYDLLFHPDSYNDEEEIFKGIMKRYEENFGS